LRIPLYFFSLIRPHPLSSTLFPYTTLFRSTLSNGQTRTPKFLKLTQNEVKYIEENYNWNDEEFLLVDFRMPSGRCHYDNYENLEIGRARLNSSHVKISYAVFCLKKKTKNII